MKRRTVCNIARAVLLGLAATSGPAADALEPKARPEATVVSGNARFTVLTPEMVRIEYSDSAKFEDRATFAVVNRELEVPRFTVDDDGEWLLITLNSATL